MVLSLHKQAFVTTHFQFITAHFVRHCALKNDLLTNREIISNLCDQDRPTSTSRTDGQTDGRTTCRSNTALCVASRGKNNRLAFEGREWRYTSASSKRHG